MNYQHSLKCCWGSNWCRMNIQLISYFLPTLQEYFGKNLRKSSALNCMIKGQACSLNHLITVQFIFLLRKTETEKLWGENPADCFLLSHSPGLSEAFHHHCNTTRANHNPISFCSAAQNLNSSFQGRIKYTKIWGTWDLSIVTIDTYLIQSPYSLLHISSMYY